MIKKSLVFLFAVFSFFAFQAFASGDEEKSVITIESAQKSEYKKDEKSGEDSIVLTGDVKISVARGKNTTVITANTINYNRATDMIYAEGNVSLSQSGGETISAASLLFNTATLEGVFDDGRAVHESSDAINLPSGSKLIVASDIFGRDSGGTVAFKTGELTFCDDDDPHWRIKATRIWLLPGGEFAFLNAVLFVGHVPLMWLPAFYYPKDELVFNPAFGYRAREGYFINTTTYLYGRKPADAVSTADLNSSSESSDSTDKIDFFSFMNTGSMKEQRREGLVLHNLDEDFTGDTSSYFKVMADYYANLGAMVGFDGAFKPGTYLTSLETTLKLGFSNTVFKSSSVYLSKNSSGDVVSDSGYFMGKKYPFRFQANLKATLAKPFSLTLSLPVYSDPYFSDDFDTRAETMDWIDYAMSGGGTDSDDDDDVTEISSYTWSLSGSKTFKVPDFFNPFVTTFSISSFSSSVVYSSKANTALSSWSEYAADSTWATYTPERKFYYPSTVTPFKISTKIAGNLVQIPSTKKNSSSSGSKLSLKVPEELDESKSESSGANSEFVDSKSKDSESVDSKPGDSESADSKSSDSSESSSSADSASPESDSQNSENEPVLAETALPSLSSPSFSTTSLDGISYNLGYSVSPDFTSQLSYSSANLTQPDDFSWQDMQSTYIQLKAPTTLTSKIGYRGNFATLTDTFTFNPVYQKHPYLKITDTTSEGGYTESSANSIKKTDYAARKLDLTDTNALTLKPFHLTKHFSDTSITWNTTIKMLELEYDTDSDIDDPQWTYLTTDLTDEDCVTTHNLNIVLAASEFDKKLTQQLSLTSTLPPQVDEYKGTLTLGFPYLTLTAGTGIKQTSSTDDTWVKEDFTQTASLSLFNSKLKFTQSYVYDMEEEEKDSLKFALSGFGLQAAKTWSYTTSYEFDSDSGWKSTGEKEFQPYQTSLAYSSGTKTFKYLSDKVSLAPSLSTSVVYDDLRPTNSYFKFIPALTFKINDFLNISFSAETKNSQIFRYFCSEDEYQSYYKGNGERNFLQDLIDSFRFDDTAKRTSSGFKIQTFKIDVTHELDDWDFNCSFSIKPRYMYSSSQTGYDSSKGKYYDYSPYFSISVAWRPLASMKTEIVDDYGEWELNP